MNNRINVALLQMFLNDNIENNLLHSSEYILKAAKAGADIVCLPELYGSHYFCQKEDYSLFNLAETVPGYSTEAFSKIAIEKIHLPLFEFCWYT